ncbi:MAG TPA: hypothetical protein VFV64_04495 [Permianibacter sp.]|nr:hypothetical protein [Permianibacter sp.]
MTAPYPVNWQSDKGNQDERTTDMTVFSSGNDNERTIGKMLSLQRRPLPDGKGLACTEGDIACLLRLPGRGTGGSRDDDRRQFSYSPLGCGGQCTDSVHVPSIPTILLGFTSPQQNGIKKMPAWGGAGSRDTTRRELAQRYQLDTSTSRHHTRPSPTGQA